MSDKYKLLIVEDDQDISDILYKEFMGEGYEVYRAWSGTEGRLALSYNPDIIIMDLMLPGMSGEELIKYVDEDIPVIAMSAKSSSDDKINMLESGCVDYVIKPFDIKELKVRVKVHLKNSKKTNKKESNKDELSFGGITLDLNLRSVAVGNETVHLTRTEFALLKLLMANKGRVVSKTQILNSLSEDTPDLVDSSLKVHVSNIRKKLKAVNEHDYIEAIWGIGFRFVPEE